MGIGAQSLDKKNHRLQMAAVRRVIKSKANDIATAGCKDPYSLPLSSSIY